MPQVNEDDMKQLVIPNIDPTKFKGHDDMYNFVRNEALKKIPVDHAVSSIKMGTVTVFNATVFYHKGTGGASFGAVGGETK